MKFLIAVLVVIGSLVARADLRNDRYTLEVTADGAVKLQVAGIPAQTLMPEFTVLWSETDPMCQRDASHPNYPVAPRTAVIQCGKSQFGRVI
jgi:hypothetical protein